MLSDRKIAVLFFFLIFLLFYLPDGCAFIKINVHRKSNFCSSSLLFDNNPRRRPADDDFFSRLVARFFPTPEDLGLSRYDSVSRPENYPAVKDIWADILAEDGNPKTDDRCFIRQTLARTNLEKRPLALVYDANRDGYNAKTFHSMVDKKGPAIVLARTTCGSVFGGYNPTGWVNYGEYRGSIAAFLFVFPNGNTSVRPIKLAKISGAGMAQVDDGGGPKFGAEGLTIPLIKSKPKLVRSKLGLYYELLPYGNSKATVLGNKGEAELSDLKVFMGVYQPGEKIPYDDAMMFSLN